jgi:integrase
VLAVLSKMFNLAERWGLRPDGLNPCRHVEKFGERKRERMLSPVELAQLGDALAAYSGSLYAVAAVKLLIFTGARLGEVLALRWEWIDFERGEARLPDSKFVWFAKSVYQIPRRYKWSPRCATWELVGAAMYAWVYLHETLRDCILLPRKLGKGQRAQG